MCGISAILYAPCQGVGSQSCRFHTDFNYTFVFGQWKPGVAYLELFQWFKPKKQSNAKENILPLLSATCYVCTSVHCLLTATYSQPGWWELLEPIPVVTEQKTSIHLLDRLSVHCRARIAFSHNQRAAKSA